MKKTALFILGGLILAQFLIPVSMILKHERILRIGVLYRFNTRPIDPTDPFQGRYVRLDFENDYIAAPTNAVEPARNEHVYVTLDTDPDGLCVLTGWSREKPEHGDYLKLKYWGKKYNGRAKNNTQRYPGLRFRLPFDRFYMDENKAPRAEKIISTSPVDLFQPPSTSLVTNCWVNVRVLNGAARIEDLLVDGIPIRELSGKAVKQEKADETKI